MRGAFEQTMRRLVPVRTVRLRGIGQPLEQPDRIGSGDRIDCARCARVPIRRPRACSKRASTRGVGWASGIFRCSGSPRTSPRWCSKSSEAGCSWRAPGCSRATGPGATVARPPLVGSTPPMQALRASIDRVAATDFTVLLEGESGVGKELVARQIHESSRRRQGPFVAVNCAALVETLLEAELFGIEERTATGVRGRRGKFEHADGGTLFLDEVSDLSLSAQAKLLQGHSGSECRAGRWNRRPSRRHPGRGGHERESREPGRASPLPGGPLLPLSGVDIEFRPCASAAPTSRCWRSTFSRGTDRRDGCSCRLRRWMP